MMSLRSLIFSACLLTTFATSLAAQTATTTAFSVSPEPAFTGQTITLTAEVAALNGTPAGDVNFVYQGRTVATATLIHGTATDAISTGSLAPGTYVLTAQYAGGSGYSGSSSAPTSITLGPAPTKTSLASSNPTVTPPAALTFTATVMRSTGSGTPTGTVTFGYAGGALGTAPLNSAGVARFTASSNRVPGGTYVITAHYNGDSADMPSSAPTTSVQVAGTVAVAVTVNPLANRHTISPLIYGTNFPPSTQYVQATNSTLARWAGDAATSYNWKTGATNLASDYYFSNFPFNGSGSGKEAALYDTSQDYVSGIVGAGAAPVMTIGMLPWVAKDESSSSFSVTKYGKQCSTAGPYHPDFGDGIETNCSTNVTGNDPNDAYFPLLDAPGTNDPANALYRSEWVGALAPLFGTGLHLYGVDNEPEIWTFVHRDVHPAATTYAEMLSLFETEIPNLKTWDPQATVLAPGSSGWYYYWNSDSYGADKTAHANLDYNPWLLNEIYWNDRVTGRRTLDWYDLHAYPDGNQANDTQAESQALALRVLRDFWDPNYQGEGGDVNQQYTTTMQPNRTYAFRIPRMRALINYIYPGTPLTFSEWNAALAGETDFSTALVDVDAWGIFGRERLYAASRWTASATTSPAYYSLLMYRNYDGANHGFGTTSIEAAATAAANVFSTYAALNSTGTQMTVMVVNKDPLNNDAVALSLGGFTPSSLTTYTLGHAHPSGIVASASGAPTTALTLPPYTAVLAVYNGTMQRTPAVEWQLNPDATMIPAGGSTTLAPVITSGTGTLTLSNPQVTVTNPIGTNGISFSIGTPQVTATAPGAITVTAGNTPGFYQFTVTGTDTNGVAQQQNGTIVVMNPAASLTRTGDNQTGGVGTTLTLVAALNVGSSGGSTNGASVFFTTSAGILSAREVLTDATGRATVTLTLPETAQTVTVTAQGQYGLGHPIVTFTATAR